MRAHRVLRGADQALKLPSEIGRLLIERTQVPFGGFKLGAASASASPASKALLPAGSARHIACSINVSAHGTAASAWRAAPGHRL
jgi:hypothetical protein